MDTALLERHLELVIEANKTVNLTRIDSPETGRLLHIEDSLSALEELNAAPEGKYGDLGSGAGFPGIPLAVASGRQTVLVESVGKKASCLTAFVSELGLADKVSVYKGRIEELSNEEGKSYSVLTARALSSLSSLLELSSPLLKMNGRLICYKAHVEEDDLQHVIGLEKKLGMSLVSTRSFTLSDNETYRTILVFEKTAKPKVLLPRKLGLAQRKPF